MERVLLVCVEDNIPSIRTIEHHGGALEDIVNEGGVPVRRYWIDVMQSGHYPLLRSPLPGRG